MGFTPPVGEKTPPEPHPGLMSTGVWPAMNTSRYVEQQPLGKSPFVMQTLFQSKPGGERNVRLGYGASALAMKCAQIGPAPRSPVSPKGLKLSFPTQTAVASWGV